MRVEVLVLDQSQLLGLSLQILQVLLSLLQELSLCSLVENIGWASRHRRWPGVLLPILCALGAILAICDPRLCLYGSLVYRLPALWPLSRDAPVVLQRCHSSLILVKADG